MDGTSRENVRMLRLVLDRMVVVVAVLVVAE